MQLLKSIPIILALTICHQAKAGGSVDCRDGYKRERCDVSLVVLPDSAPDNPAKCKVSLPEIYIKNVSQDRATLMVFSLQTAGYQFHKDSMTINGASPGTPFFALPLFNNRAYLVLDTVIRIEDFTYDMQVWDPRYSAAPCKTYDPTIHNQN